MPPRLFAAACLVAALGLAAPAAAASKDMDYELTRAYDLLDRGQDNRAQALFKTYLERSPNNRWAREGYVKAGGSLAELGLEAPKPAAPKPTPEAEAVDENAPVKAIDEDMPGWPAKDDAPAMAAKADEADMEVVDSAAPKPRAAWIQRLAARARRTGFVLLGILSVLAALGLGIFIGWLALRFARWHEARNLERLRALAAAGGVSAYAALRHWTAWWGLGIDADLAAKRALDIFHAEGWTCVEATRDSWLFPSIPAPQRGLTVLLSMLTGGFLHYYIGPNYLLKREPGAPRPAAPAPPAPPAEVETA